MSSPAFSSSLEAHCWGSPSPRGAALLWAALPSVIPCSIPNPAQLEPWEVAGLGASVGSALGTFREPLGAAAKADFSPFPKECACVWGAKSSAPAPEAARLHPSPFQQCPTCGWQIPPQKSDVPAERRCREGSPAASPEHPPAACQ